MIAALFTCRSSAYQGIADCWDEHRDARLYLGRGPVVAHPPCRAWGQLSHVAKPRGDEKALGLWAVQLVRQVGGVVEHPANSRLWRAAEAPRPGAGRDRWGGWTLGIEQSWWGHRARKRTILYVKGCSPRDLPPMPLRMSRPVTTVERMCKAERERTPPDLAEWLCDLARRCR